MAAIVISSPGGVQTNPTNYILPYQKNNMFFDSMLCQNDDGSLNTISNSSSPNAQQPQGLLINNQGGQWVLGDIQGEYNGAFIETNGSGEVKNWIGSQADFFLNFATEGNIVINNTDIVKVSAGLPSNRYLQLIINGSTYKIALLNNTL